MSSSNSSSIYFYNPSIAAAILFTVLFTLPTTLLFYLPCSKPKSLYLICLPIGALIEVAGYAARSYSVKHVANVTSYAISASFIVVAPLFIAAADYLLLGRLMLFVLPQGSQHLLGVSPRFLTRVFVSCDILSLLIQCSGSGVAASENWVGNSGIDVLMAGLSMQLATNVVFMVLVALFYKRTMIDGMVTATAPDRWRAVLWVVIVSITLVFVRSTYRLIEFGLGFHGYPFTHEWIFYVLESVPMLLAISLFCFVYPGRHLPRKNKRLSNRGVEASKY